MNLQRIAFLSASTAAIGLVGAALAAEPPILKAGLWEVGSASRERAALDTRGDPVSSFAFAPNGRLLAAGLGSFNGWVRLIDVSDKAPIEWEACEVGDRAGMRDWILERQRGRSIAIEVQRVVNFVVAD